MVRCLIWWISRCG